MIGPAQRRIAAALGLIALLTACGPDEIPTAGGAAGMRRLTEDQYRNSIADIFGSDILIAGRFDPVVRPEHGLLAAGTSEIADKLRSMQFVPFTSTPEQFADIVRNDLTRWTNLVREAKLKAE